MKQYLNQVAEQLKEQEINDESIYTAMVIVNQRNEQVFEKIQADKALKRHLTKKMTKEVYEALNK